MVINNYKVDLYDHNNRKEDREPLLVSFAENDHFLSISLEVTRELGDALVVAGVLDSENHLLNDDYKELSDFELRNIVNEKMSSHSYEDREQIRNLVKFLQIDAGHQLFITRIKPEVQTGVDNDKSTKAWRIQSKAAPQLVTSNVLPNILKYYIELEQYCTSFGFLEQ